MSDTESPEGQTSSILRRAVLLALLITFCLVAYGAMLTRFNMAKAPVEAELGAPPSESQVRLYLQPTHIDPVTHCDSGTDQSSAGVYGGRRNNDRRSKLRSENPAQ